MRRFALLSLFMTLAGVVSCDNRVDPVVPSMPDPLLERVDATTTGDPHFYFLPPLARRVQYQGVFEPWADLTAQITVDGGGSMGLPIVSNLNREFYEARWQAPADADQATVSFMLFDKPMGSLDLKAAVTPEERREARVSGLAVFTPGTLVQIRVRVEVGAGEGVPEGPRFMDGRAVGGDRRLLFLPPTSRVRSNLGSFDFEALDELAVELWLMRGGERSVLIRRFTSDGPLRGTAVPVAPRPVLKLNRNAEFYQGIWGASRTRPWRDYRVTVYLRGEELGWFDLDVIPRGETALFDRARRSGAYAVYAGNEAFIRFWVQKAAATPVAPALAYVVNSLPNTVSVIDLTTNGVVATVDVGSQPSRVAVTPDRAFAYVTNQEGGSVSVLETATNTVVATIPVAGRPVGITISPDGERAYVANSGEQVVSVISTATNTVLDAIDVGPGSPSRVALTPDGAFLYVSRAFAPHGVAVISTETHEVVDAIEVGSGPFGLAVTPDGAFAYVALNNAPGGVAVVETATNQVVTTVAEANAADVAITPDGAFVYVTINAHPGRVAVIETATNTVVETIPVPVNVVDVAISSDGKFAYVTHAPGNDTPGSLFVISTESRSVVDRIEVGPRPLGVAVSFGAASDGGQH